MIRNFIGAVAFSAALAALPATASADHDRGGWGRSSAYSYFAQDFRDAHDAIRYGRRNGDFTPYDAESFRIELDDIHERLDSYAYNDGRLSGWEIQDIRRRFDRLYGFMRHERRQQRRYDGWRDWR
jgi:hypothetical protein